MNDLRCYSHQVGVEYVFNSLGRERNFIPLTVWQDHDYHVWQMESHGDCASYLKTHTHSHVHKYSYIISLMVRLSYKQRN